MAASTTGQMAEAFWSFSTTLYAKPGVEPKLLALQDRDGLEVNLALFCLYAATCQIAFDHASITAMRGVGLAWGHEVVGHLRQARRLMKPSAQGNREAMKLRDEVKAIELAAEKAMQAALTELLVGLGADTHGDTPRGIAARNFAAWFDEEGVDGAAPREAVAGLIEAAFPV